MLLIGDCREKLRELSEQGKRAQTCVTSPPYWGLRDYGHDGQLGLEQTPDEYVASMVDVFSLVRDVLADDGTLWLNLGDSYNGSAEPGRGGNIGSNPIHGQSNSARAGRVYLKPKDLVGIPWRVAFALRDAGWYLRQDIIWHKPNPMPESVTDRCTKAHEYLFLLSKNARYYYDADAIASPSKHAGEVGSRNFSHQAKGAGIKGTGNAADGVITKVSDLCNKRSVWTVTSSPFSDSVKTVRWRPVPLDELSDDNWHIAFPDCPIYGGLFDLLAMAVCDGCAGDSLIRTLHNDGRLSPVPKDGYVPIGQLLSWSFGQQSLDSLLQWSELIANQHSSQTHKTGLFLSTSPACMPYAQRLNRIERTLAALGSSELHLDTEASSIWGRDFCGNQRPQTLWRRIGKLGSVSECFAACALFYRKETENNSHFATYPPALIEPCILAGSRPDDTVLDPFLGSGTTAQVAQNLGRKWIGIELNPEYAPLIERRIAQQALPL